MEVDFSGSEQQQKHQMRSFFINFIYLKTYQWSIYTQRLCAGDYVVKNEECSLVDQQNPGEGTELILDYISNFWTLAVPFLLWPFRRYDT